MFMANIKMPEFTRIGRPRTKVDAGAILALSKAGIGHKAIAKIITELGQFVSASTVKRILKSNII
jgi:hypothetical protein